MEEEKEGERMTNEEAIKRLVNATYSEEWQGNEALTEANHMAIDALETSDKRLEQAINKIASEVSEYMSCSMYRCPCVLDCNTNIRCEERIEEWLLEIVKEVEE